jgi:hypothetical protein
MHARSGPHAWQQMIGRSQIFDFMDVRGEGATQRMCMAKAPRTPLAEEQGSTRKYKKHRNAFGTHIFANALFKSINQRKVILFSFLF